MGERRESLPVRLIYGLGNPISVQSVSVDPPADVLDLSRVRGGLMAHVRAGAPGGLALPQSGGASFHAVPAGTAWLRLAGDEPLQLMPGDVVLLPSGTAHRISSTPAGRCIAYD